MKKPRKRVSDNIEPAQLDGEIWKDIPGYEGHYQVSNLGRVRVCRVKQLTQFQNLYHYTQLTAEGKSRMWKVAHLVALAFKGSRPPGQFVCHRNGDRTDDSETNLEYDTPKGNADDRERHEKTARGEKVGTAKLSQPKVEEIRRRLAAGERQIPLAIEYGVSQSLISAIKREEIWSHA